MGTMKPVIVRLRKSLSYADKITDEMWQMMMSRTQTNYEDHDRLERENELNVELSGCLDQLGNNLAVALEMLGLPDTRKQFLVKWSAFQKSGLGETKDYHNDNGDYIVSEPLQLCWSIIQMIEAPYESITAGEEKRALEILEFVLESTARIVADAGITPVKENDIQKPMHKHLTTTFSEFTSQLTISKPIVSFKPDGGIIDLSAAIEFKFVADQKELNTAIHGLTEDLSGYSGSLDWTRFYTVIYQTGPFGTPKQITDALRRSGNAKRWRVFLVTGPGGRSKDKQPISNRSNKSSRNSIPNQKNAPAQKNGG